MTTILAPSVLTQLRQIEPSRDDGIAYYPCRAQLHEGTHVDYVYVVDQAQFERIWGVGPERPTLDASTIVALQEAPMRLPKRFADQLYRAGESGMGYCIFTLRFQNGVSHVFSTGNVVDFPGFPPPLHPRDVIEVLPHTGRGEPMLGPAAHVWCPVSDLATAI